MSNDLIITGADTLIPVQVAAAGEHTAIRFVEFFTANIRNPNTKAAYARAVAGSEDRHTQSGSKAPDVIEGTEPRPSAAEHGEHQPLLKLQRDPAPAPYLWSPGRVALQE